MCTTRPETIDGLWKLNNEWHKSKRLLAIPEQRELIVTTSTAFYRREVLRYLNEILPAYAPTKRKVILYPSLEPLHLRLIFELEKHHRQGLPAIRVADDAMKNAFVTHAAGRRIESGELGTVTVRLSGLCSQPGNLHFSANDGRMNSADRTGTYWSNTVQVSCR